MNFTRTLLLSMFAIIQTASANIWTQTGAPNESWQAVAMSADGVKLVAVTSDSGIWTSTNSGAAWQQTSAQSTGWDAVASSADGVEIFATTYEHNYDTGLNDGLIYMSTNSGLTWAPTSAPPDSWIAIASSADGQDIVAVAYEDIICFSTNAGVNWTASNVYGGWLSVACSADGKKMVAADGGRIFTSTDYGASWTQADAPFIFWCSVASSSDGVKLFSVATPAHFFGGYNPSGGFSFSGDSGMNWGDNYSFSASSIASSADGQKLVAANSEGQIYTSVDSGTTWTSGGPNEAWTAVASSSDGNKTFAIVNGGGIWTAQSTPIPLIKIIPTIGGFALAWLYPSTNFDLQQSSNLINWIIITNIPVINFTNMQYEVTVSTTNPIGFFRLKSY